MEKVIHCRDLGYDCDGIIRAHTEKEAIEMAILHAERLHGLPQTTPEVIMKMKSVLKDQHAPKLELF